MWIFFHISKVYIKNNNAESSDSTHDIGSDPSGAHYASQVLAVDNGRGNIAQLR